MILNFRDCLASARNGLTHAPKQIASVSAVVLATFAVTAPKLADASTLPIPEVFIIAEHTAPTSATAALSITTETVYKLNLNGRLRATSAQIVGNFDVNVETGLTFNNDDYNNGVNRDATKLTDQVSSPGTANPVLEPGQGTATYVNSEIATWDNVNIRDASYAYDASEQIDFGRNAPMIFNPVEGGFTELVVAELGGLNPFDLWLCESADCQDTNGVDNAQQLFGGLSATLSQALFDTQHFAMPDNSDLSELDQTWLFRFSTPVTGYVRILENDTRGLFTNARLQTDFIGAGGIPTPAVPVPTSLPLLAGGLGLLGLMMRRRRKA